MYKRRAPASGAGGGVSAAAGYGGDRSGGDDGDKKPTSGARRWRFAAGMCIGAALTFGLLSMAAVTNNTATTTATSSRVSGSRNAASRRVVDIMRRRAGNKSRPLQDGQGESGSETKGGKKKKGRSVLAKIGNLKGSSSSSGKVSAYADEQQHELYLQRMKAKQDSRNAASANNDVSGRRPQCLLIYHVPKTGGTSLEEYFHIIERKLNFNMFNWNYFVANYPNGVPQDKDNYKFDFQGFDRQMIHKGHITPNFEKVTGTESCAKITVLREPVDRVVSAFYFHGHKDKDWTSCLHGTLDKCKLQYEYINDVVRRFANLGTWWNSFKPSKYVVGTLPNDLSHAALEKAKERLDKFDYVCFLPDLRDCLQRFTKTVFGVDVKLPEDIKKLPLGGGKKKEVSDELRRQIEKANKLDVELYQWAQGRFSGY